MAEEHTARKGLQPGKGPLEDDLRPRGGEAVPQEQDPYAMEQMRPGKPPLADEMRPLGGEPVEQPREPGSGKPDTAGQHGRMAPEAAKRLEPRE
jgi:hypothetical protein